MSAEDYGHVLAQGEENLKRIEEDGDVVAVLEKRAVSAKREGYFVIQVRTRYFGGERDKRDRLIASEDNCMDKRDRLRASKDNCMDKRDRLRASKDNCMDKRDRLRASKDNCMDKRDRLRASEDNCM